jgi:hypothetical protein
MSVTRALVAPEAVPARRPVVAGIPVQQYDLRNPPNLAATQDSRRVVTVYASQAAAAKARGPPSSSGVATAIARGSVCDGHRWRWLVDVTDPEVLATHDGEVVGEPQARAGVRVQRLTASLAEVCRLFGTSHARVRRAHETGEPYLGARWRIVE